MHRDSDGNRLCTIGGKSIFNPRRACAARVTVLGLSVCLYVCMYVDDYSRTVGNKTAYKRYH